MPLKYKGICSRIGIIAVVLCLSSIITSCGSGSGSGPVSKEIAPAQTGSSPEVFTFFSADVPGCSSHPSNSVYLCRNDSKSTKDVVAVDVHLNSDAPVFGAAFDLLLDQSSVEVARNDDQSIDFSPPDPPQAGSPIWKYLFVALKEGQEDTLIIGVSRGKGLEPLTGDIHVVTLKFKIPTGKSPLYFSHNNIIDPTGNPIDILMDKWYGGYLAPDN